MCNIRQILLNGFVKVQKLWVKKIAVTGSRFFYFEISTGFDDDRNCVITFLPPSLLIPE
jgi:hypothetical protein